MHAIYEAPLADGWKEEPLGQIIETKRGCSWSKEQERDRPTTTALPVIRIPNIQSRLDLADLLFLEDVKEAQRRDSAVTRGWTLMVASNGNPKRIGDAVLIEEDREMVFASFLLALRPRKDRNVITDAFLAAWLRLHRVHEFISETSQMTTGLANLSWGACKKLPVRYPKDHAEQDIITNALQSSAQQTDAIQQWLDCSRRLEGSLVKSLLSGVVRLST